MNLTNEQALLIATLSYDFENAKAETREFAIEYAREALDERLCTHLQRLGIGSDGVPTAFHDAELYPALQLRADAGLRLILQLIKADILEAADPNLQRLKLTAFGRAVVGKPTDSALDAYVGELQAKGDSE